MASTIIKPPSSSTPPGDGGSGGAKPSGIARATGLMMVTVLLSRILGFVRDALIAKYFGRGPETDAYNAAFTVPDLLFYLLQSGALSSTIVPILTEYRQQGKDRAADKTVSIVASTIFVFIGLLICIMWINARALTIALNLGFSDSTVDLSVPLTRILLPAQMFFFLGGLMMGVLYSRKQFLIPALGPVIYNASIIFGGVVLRHWLGLYGLVWGAIAGAFVGNFLIPFIAVNRLGVRLRPSLDIRHPAAMKVWRMLLPIGLGVSLPSIDQMVNKEFASYLAPGDTTAVMNAYRLMLLPIGIFAQAMAMAVFPTLSGQAAENNKLAMRRTMNQSLRNILFLTIPASALMFLLAEPVVAFIYQSGKYTHADVLVTASALRSLSLGIFAWSGQSLLTRGFYALQNSKVPVISGAVVSVLFIAMNAYVVHPVIQAQGRVAALSQQTAGLQGSLNSLSALTAPSQDAVGKVNNAQTLLAGAPGSRDAASSLGPTQDSLTQLAAQVESERAAAQSRLDAQQAQLASATARLDRLANRAVWELGLTTSIAAAIHMVALFFLLRLRLNGLNSRRLLVSVARTLLATAVLCGVTVLLKAVYQTLVLDSDPQMAPKISAISVILVAGLSGIGSFVAAARLTKMPELQSAIDLLRRRRAS